MDPAPTAISRIEQLIAALARAGYDVQKVAFNPNLTPPPRRSGLTLKFGLRNADGSNEAVIGLDAIIDVRGDLCPGRLRQWRLTKSIPGEGGFTRIAIDALVTVEGDVSAHLVQVEGSAALSMTNDVLVDAAKTLRSLSSQAMAERMEHLTVVANVNVAGDLATGFSGLSPKLEGNETVTVEGQVAGLAVCDLLLNEILPNLNSGHSGDMMGMIDETVIKASVAVAAETQPLTEMLLSTHVGIRRFTRRRRRRTSSHQDTEAVTSTDSDMAIRGDTATMPVYEN